MSILLVFSHEQHFSLEIQAGRYVADVAVEAMTVTCAQASLLGMRPVLSRGRVLGCMLCHCRLDILPHCERGCLHFPFARGLQLLGAVFSRCIREEARGVLLT